MIDDYEEALSHFYEVEHLNEKGYRALIKVLRQKIIELKQKIVDLEHELTYKGLK